MKFQEMQHERCRALAIFSFVLMRNMTAAVTRRLYAAVACLLFCWAATLPAQVHAESTGYQCKAWASSAKTGTSDGFGPLFPSCYQAVHWAWSTGVYAGSEAPPVAACTEPPVPVPASGDIGGCPTGPCPSCGGAYSVLWLAYRDGCPYPNQVLSTSLPQICLTVVNLPPCTKCAFGVGDPIYPLTGGMKEAIAAGMRLRGVELAFTYDTHRKLQGLPSVVRAN